MKESNSSVGVLVVEDEPIIAMDMKYSLADLGFRQVHVVSSLSAGYAIFRSKPLDLAILDVNIGTDLVFPLAAGMVSKKIPIIFSTGRGPGEFPAEWTAHPIIQKPWDERCLKLALLALGFNVGRPQNSGFNANTRFERPTAIA